MGISKILIEQREFCRYLFLIFMYLVFLSLTFRGETDILYIGIESYFF